MRRLKQSILASLLLTLLVAVAMVGWQYINKPHPPENKPHSPEAAWDAYLQAITCLQDTGDRKLSAQLFDEVVRRFPDSKYTAESRELSQLLVQMVAEDKAWTEPRDPNSLPLTERIRYHVHHIRDVNCYQVFDPGMCNLLSDFGSLNEGDNAAIELHKIGKPSIPYLIPLLTDRRPIRSVGFWRSFHPSRTVLRYQDAAIQILNELLPAPAYERITTSGYFSNEPQEIRDRIVKEITDGWDG